MIPEDKSLFLELGSVNKMMATFGFSLLEGVPLTAEEQHEFGARLIRLGQAIQQRGQRNPGAVIEVDSFSVDDLALYASLPPAS